MSIMGKILGVLGFESVEKESKPKTKKEKKVKASYNFKKKQKVEKRDNIDGVSVVYPESFGDANKVFEYIKNNEPVIISIEFCDKDDVDKLIAYVDGSAQAVSGKVSLLEKNRYYIFLPDGVEIEE